MYAFVKKSQRMILLEAGYIVNLGSARFGQLVYRIVMSAVVGAVFGLLIISPEIDRWIQYSALTAGVYVVAMLAFGAPSTFGLAFGALVSSFLRGDLSAVTSVIVWVPPLASLIAYSTFVQINARPNSARWRAPTISELVLIIFSFALASSGLSWLAFSFIGGPEFSFSTAFWLILGIITGSSMTFIALNVLVVLLIELKRAAH